MGIKLAEDIREVIINEIKNKGLTVSQINRDLGINKTSLYNLLNRKQLMLESFNYFPLMEYLGQGVIDKVADLLEIKK